MKSSVINKINRLKGMIDCMEEMAELNGEWEHPMIDKLSKTINEIIEETEKGFDRNEYFHKELIQEEETVKPIGIGA